MKIAPLPPDPKAQLYVDLLVTDSLDRPLARAPYSLHEGTVRWTARRLDTGELDASGRVSLPWNSGGMTLVIGHRALRLTAGPVSGPAHTRNRLTCLGFDTGRPDDDVDEALVDEALGGLRAIAERQHDKTTFTDDAALLDAWCSGRLGVGQTAPPTDPVGRRSFVTGAYEAASVGTETHGTQPPADPGSLFRRVDLAVTPGPRGSQDAQNRIVIYDWFTGFGSPLRAGNLIEALIDGENAWGATATDIATARQELCITSWSIDPDIELVRPKTLAQSPPAERSQHRLADSVERFAQRGGHAAILVWDGFGTPLAEGTLRKWGANAGDGVDVQKLAHPRLTGSFHQKTVVVDRRTAYCGGLNLRQNDWDTQEHLIDDPRRHPHEHGPEQRAVPMSAYRPRHDVAIRIRGPLVFDLHENFREQWERARDLPAQRARRPLGWLSERLLGQEPARPIEPMKAPPAPEGPVVAQFVQTDPGRKPKEQAVYDVLLRAIHNAHRLIYIENQYFRSERILRALERSMLKHPRLQLVVVTNEVEAPWCYVHGAAWHTDTMQRRLRALRPDFHLYQLMTCGRVEGQVRYQPIEVHAKVMIVDDMWATVGSANLNERSIESESEANVAIDNPRFAASLRRRLMAEHLGLDPDAAELRCAVQATKCWKKLAQNNAESRRLGKIASGHAHPFVQTPSLRLLRGRARWF